MESMGPDSQDLIGKVAGAIGLLAFIPYLLSTARGRTRPNRASWLIWTLVGGVLAASFYATGGGTSIWVPLSYVVGPIVTLGFALRYGEGGWSRFDGLCLLGAVLSFGLWLASGSPFAALLTSIAIDAFGVVPTARKAWRDPDSEDPLAWSLFLLANSLNLAAVPTWTLEVALLPIYFWVGSLCVAIPIVRRAVSRALVPAPAAVRQRD